MDQLPEDCIYSILAFMSTKDVCRSAAVSSAFRSAADSDALWSSFLPEDYENIFSPISSSSSSPLSLNSLSKKALYFHLCDHPALTGIGNSRIVLEKESRKICYMIGASDLEIRSRFVSKLKWNFLPPSRFSDDVALVQTRHWLEMIEINTKVDDRKLSPKTSYSVYIIFILFGCTHDQRRLHDKSIVISLYVEGSELIKERKVVLTDSFDETLKVPYERRDGWMEIEMGRVFTQSGEYHPVVTSLVDIYDNCPISGIVIEGIEIRPSSQSFLG